MTLCDVNVQRAKEKWTNPPTCIVLEGLFKHLNSFLNNSGGIYSILVVDIELPITIKTICIMHQSHSDSHVSLHGFLG
jgi:hypothetical protein